MSTHAKKKRNHQSITHDENRLHMKCDALEKLGSHQCKYSRTALGITDRTRHVHYITFPTHIHIFFFWTSGIAVHWTLVKFQAAQEHETHLVKCLI